MSVLWVTVHVNSVLCNSVDLFTQRFKYAKIICFLANGSYILEFDWQNGLMERALDYESNSRNLILHLLSNLDHLVFLRPDFLTYKIIQMMTCISQ